MSSVVSQTLPYHIFPDLNVFVVKASGELALASLFQHVQELLGDRQYKPGTNAIYDLRQVTRVVGLNDTMRDMAAQVSDHRVISEQSRASVIIPEDNHTLDYMAKLYATMAMTSHIEFRSFFAKDILQALKFVGVPGQTELLED